MNVTSESKIAQSNKQTRNIEQQANKKNREKIVYEQAREFKRKHCAKKEGV